ncbi:uncharacterized protein LOC128723893 [Anopheles nili]|uniref:uncharacterized protein LOC128723893 n=1 Tax=Anopheles nili TaxID=185578 RepID=UPI00237B5F43|nr:uncharacterized protein LOC128723893 [Anopheles nili]
MANLTRLVLGICLLLLAFETCPVLSDSEEPQTEDDQETVTEETQEPTAAPEGEATEQEDQNEGVSNGNLLSQASMVNIFVAPSACKPGYRVDHKGKCRPAL